MPGPHVSTATTLLVSGLHLAVPHWTHVIPGQRRTDSSSQCQCTGALTHHLLTAAPLNLLPPAAEEAGTAPSSSAAEAATPGQDRPAFLLVHGFGAFGEQWRGQIKALTQAGYQVCNPLDTADCMQHFTRCIVPACHTKCQHNRPARPLPMLLLVCINRLPAAAVDLKYAAS